MPQLSAEPDATGKRDVEVDPSWAVRPLPAMVRWVPLGYRSLGRIPA